MELAPGKIAKRIGLPVRDWPGNCHTVAALLLFRGITTGNLMYGHWLGPVAENSLFSGKAIVRHGWIEDNNIIIDPTRWVFENAKPYIYVGTNDHYDADGNKLRGMMMRPLPKLNREQKLFRPPEEVRDSLELVMLTNARTICLDRLHWVATLPLPWLKEEAKAIFTWIIQIGYAGLIPIDNRRMVLKDRSLGLPKESRRVTHS